MNPDQFEEYLAFLSNDEYDYLMERRIARLNPEQQVIARARENNRKERHKLFLKLENANLSEEEVKETLLSFASFSESNCEHGRSYCKPCAACGEIDHIMFPELFHEDGNRLNEDE